MRRGSKRRAETVVVVQGYVDVVGHEFIRGWAYEPSAPGKAVVLMVAVDGLPAARVVANVWRQDLELAGIGDGRHGFLVDAATLGLPLAAATVAVQVEATDEHLPRSPWRLEGPLELTEPVRQRFTRLLDSPGSEQDLRDRVLFLAGEVDRLLQRLADTRSRRPEREAARERKWRWRAEEGPAPAPLPLRALVIDSTLPGVGRDAGSNAVRSHMQSLGRIGYEVTFVAADLTGDVGASEAAGAAVVGAPWVGSVEEVLRRQSGAWDLVYLHRVEVAGPYVRLARHHAPRARLVYSLADLHSLRLLRQAEAEQRPELFAHARHVRGHELAAAVASDAVLTHSTAEAALLRQWLPAVDCHVVPWVFRPQPTPAPWEARAGVAFIGSFGHEPNLDAAIWLIDEIMPLVWQTDPAIECLVAGSGMPAGVLDGRDARIRVLGRVDDLPALLDGVRATVAPLAYGAGLKGKVGDSLAAGVPCVCSPVAAEGYALPSPLLGLVAGDAAGLAASVVRVHSDAALFADCRAAGLAYVAAGFSEAVVDEGMRRVAGLSVPGQASGESGGSAAPTWSTMRR